MNIPDFIPVNENTQALGHTGLSACFDATLRSEISEDLILPDSLPDVKKLLRIECSPRITEETCEGGSLRYAGECKCDVLYVTDTNRLRSTEFTVRFSGKESTAEGSDQRVMLIPRISRNDSRMLNPRKLSLRLGLEVQACVLCGHDLRCRVTMADGGEEDAYIQQKTETVQSLVFTPTERMGLPFKEDLELENNQPTVAEIIACKIEGIPTQVSVGDGKADVCSDIIVRCLYETDTGRCHELIKRYSIRETVEIPDARASMSGIAQMNVCGSRISAQNNSYGEKRILEIDAEIDFTVWCFDNETASMVQDAYSTAYVTETKQICPNLCRFDRVLSSAFSVNYSVPKSEIGAERVGSIFSGSVVPGEISIRYDGEKNKYLVEGKAAVVFLSELEREEEAYGKEYLSVKAEADIRGELDARAVQGKPILRQPQISQIRFRADESKLYADFEIGFTMPMLESKQVACVSETVVLTDQPHPARSDGAILLYYPVSGDTLWSVAKQYQTREEEIASANHLASHNLSEKKVLLVPNSKAE